MELARILFAKSEEELQNVSIGSYQSAQASKIQVDR